MKDLIKKYLLDNLDCIDKSTGFKALVEEKLPYVKINHFYMFFESMFDPKNPDNIEMYTFYQFPFSEISHSEDEEFKVFDEKIDEKIIKKMNEYKELEFSSYSKDNTCFIKLNSMFYSDSKFKWKIIDTQVIKNIIERDREECDLTEDTSENTSKIFKNDCPINYPKMMFDFEKTTLYQNKIIIPHRIYRKNCLVGLVFFTINKDVFKNLDIDKQSIIKDVLKEVSDYMGYKMYNNVVMPHIKQKFTIRYSETVLMRIIAYFLYISRSNFNTKSSIIMINPKNGGCGENIEPYQIGKVLKFTAYFDDPDHFKRFESLINEWLNEISHWHQVYKTTNKTAITSILVDSFAHNIAAHSMQEKLKWLNSINHYLRPYKKGNFPENVKTPSVLKKENIYYDYQFRYKYLRYINNKATFWSGVIKDSVLGGSIVSWSEIVDEFIENEYFLATIAGSENIYNIHINIHIDGNEQGCYKNINLSTLFNGKGEIIEIGPKNGKIKSNLNELGKVFLPGGDIGKQSLYTIWENVLRNIKHCDHNFESSKFTKESEIGLNIDINKLNKIFSIKVWLSNKSDDTQEINITIIKGSDGSFALPEDISGSSFVIYNNEKEISQNDVKVWLSNKSDDTQENKITIIKGIDGAFAFQKDIKSCDFYPKYLKLDDEEINEIKIKYKKSIAKIINEKSKKDIVDDKLKPRMGGVFQNKICAAQLITNDFDKVSEKFVSIYDPEKKKYISKQDQYIKYSEDKNEAGKCQLLSEFRLWKGANINDCGLESTEQSENSPGNGLILDENRNIIENVRRFKIFVAKDDEKKQIEKLGVVRVVADDGKECEDEYAKYIYYYNKWMSEWFDNLNLKILLKQDGECFGDISNTGGIWDIKEFNENYTFNDKTTYEQCIDFDHAKNRYGDRLLFRNTGNINNYFIVNDDTLYLTSNGEKSNIISHKDIANDFTEIVASSICIVDNRVNNLIEQYKNDTDVCNSELSKSLRILSYSEDISINDINKTQYDFLIIHLSYIEKYKEYKSLNEFIANKLKHAGNYIFKKLIITSGRGRDGWYENLGDKLKTRVYFLPPESITSSISYGIMIEDDFEIKRGLIKLLMN